MTSVLPYAVVNAVHTHPTGSAGLPPDDGVSEPDKKWVALWHHLTARAHPRNPCRFLAERLPQHMPERHQGGLTLPPVDFEGRHSLL